MDFDASWCPVCDRQIDPKRIQVPIPPPPPPPSLAASPSSPPSSPNKQQQQPNTTTTARRSKGTLRQKGGGLVQGTGRLKPNGTIKRTNSATKPQPLPQSTSAPIKFRTIIDQSPIPLYCSDECKMADLNSIHRGRPTNPDCEESLNHRTEFSSKHDIETGSKVPSIAKLAAIYNFPPLPPPAPIFTDDSSNSDSDGYPTEYNSGVMMAARRISDFCPKPAKPQTGLYRSPPEPRKPVVGWTDGSNAWRASVYNFSSPNNTSDPSYNDDHKKAYRSFTASSHRSRGMHSTMGQLPSSYPEPSTYPSTNEQLLSKFSESFTRRCESRAASLPMSTSPTSIHSVPSVSGKRERSLLVPGAEGKLLVPNVKLKINSASSGSLSSGWSGPTTASSRRSVRSPLSATSYCSDEDTETQRCDSATSLPNASNRPVVETRSWSYDNFKTYPIMQLPPKKVKRTEKHIVDGEEVEVEVEVIVEEPRKRLFLFPAPIRMS